MIKRVLEISAAAAAAAATALTVLRLDSQIESHDSFCTFESERKLHILTFRTRIPLFTHLVRSTNKSRKNNAKKGEG